MPFLAAVKEAKLRTFVTPGQSLIVSAKIAHEGSGFAMTQASVAVEGKTVCNADLTFRIVDFPKGEFLDNMLAVAKRISFPLETVPHG
jgi:3-hydroxyacyl-[acyl-carrier-protein] dehydratase